MKEKRSSKKPLDQVPKTPGRQKTANAENSEQSKTSIHAQCEDVFLFLCDLPESRRERELQKLAADAPELYHSVVAMLEHDQKDDPLFDQNPRLMKDSRFGRLQSGDRVDSYEIVGVLGHGGMGVVYSARKIDLYENLVALKIVNSGFDSKGVIERFEAERKVLARFAHPNLTQIYDGGITEAGLPYFVMEYVDGKSVTSYCRDNAVGLEDRLNMFAKICDAIHHAHQKGVIHRDIKPSNIMVTEIDGNPVPKVIDFGTAKSLDRQGVALKDGLTITGDIIGTPLYMSPEQAESGSATVDVRSDIYSLGVVLYELLTGSTPLRLADLEGLNSIKMLEAVRDYRVDLPSTRVAADNETNQLLGYEIQTKSLAKKLKGDIDLVVTKALAKDVDLRYESVADLRNDVVNHLRGESVSAAAPSLKYKAGKFVRKYPWPIAVSGLLGAGVLVFAVIATVQANQNSKSLAANRELIAQLEKKTQDLEQTIGRAESAELTQQEVLEARKYASALERAAIEYTTKIAEAEVSEKVDRESSVEQPIQTGSDSLKRNTSRRSSVAVEMPSDDTLGSEISQSPEIMSTAFLEQMPGVSTFYGQQMVLSALGLRCLLPDVMKHPDYLPLIVTWQDSELIAEDFCLLLLAKLNEEFESENKYFGVVHCALAQAQCDEDKFVDSLRSINAAISVFESEKRPDFSVFAEMIRCKVHLKTGDTVEYERLKSDVLESLTSAKIPKRKAALIQALLEKEN